jgi:VCBS repeat-containing protein
VPNPNFNGTDTFTYQITDGVTTSGVATVTITVRPAQDRPVGNEDMYGTQVNMPLVVGPAGVLVNDYDLDTSDVLTAVLQDNPQNGVLNFHADGSFDYTPNAGFTGVDWFRYIPYDGHQNGNLTTVTITVGGTGINGSPIAVPDEYTVYEDTTTTFPAPGLLANDFDFEDDVLTATLVTPPLHGTVHVYQNGAFVYTPYPNYYGDDHFTYQAHDSISDSNVAGVTIHVLPVADAPIANPDFYSTNADNPITVAAPGVLANDVDYDLEFNTTLTALLRDNPLSGTVSLNGDGSFTYTPYTGFLGTDVFTYTVSDGTTESDYTTVTILVRPLNHRPVAVDDVYQGNEDTTTSLVAPGVLLNDIDDDGDTLTVILVQPPLNGTLTLNADGSFDYLPNLNFHGVDTFSYRVTDGMATSNAATVTLNIANVEDAPVANPDMYSTQEDTPLNITAPGILANDVDVDHETLYATVGNSPVNGVLSLLSDGSFSYTPNSGFNGVDTFTYTVSDGTLQSNATTVTITVGPVNDAPVANNDFYNVYEDTPKTIPAPGVQSNDTDVDDSILTSTLITSPLYGTVTLSPDGGFVYTPLANYNGPDSFTYQDTDGVNNSNVATVNLNVVPVHDAPLANPDF